MPSLGPRTGTLGFFCMRPVHTPRSRSLSLPRFSTVEPSGLLLYNGRLNERHDFLAVEIIQGQLQLKYSTGRLSPCPSRDVGRPRAALGIRTLLGGCCSSSWPHCLACPKGCQDQQRGVLGTAPSLLSPTWRIWHTAGRPGSPLHLSLSPQGNPAPW